MLLYSVGCTAISVEITTENNSTNKRIVNLAVILLTLVLAFGWGARAAEREGRKKVGGALNV